jgi:hypothetical protein
VHEKPHASFLAKSLRLRRQPPLFTNVVEEAFCELRLLHIP